MDNMNNKKGDHLSHIQIPRFILKRFVNSNGFFAYYDVEKRMIGNKGTPKSTNTEYDYYSILGEKYWHDEIETELSQLLIKLDTIDTDEPISCFPSCFDMLSKKYFFSLLARNPVNHKTVRKASIYLQFINDSFHNDIASSFIYSNSLQLKDLSQWTSTLMINKTKKPFIMPMCGFMEYLYNNIGYIAMPIDPQKAILLFPPNARDLYIDTDHIKYALINTDAMIMRLNRFLFETQIQQGYGCIVSRDKCILDEIEPAFRGPV